MPEQDLLTVYLRRMREHGWDVRPTIRKAMECGAHIVPEASLTKLALICAEARGKLLPSPAAKSASSHCLVASAGS